MSVGRFAPTPSAELHLGNLRTALVAWLFARTAGSDFLLRIEDLDPASRRPGVAEGQVRDLTLLGLDWDGSIVRQSEHLERMHDAIAQLDAAGLVYPCYCSRREVLEAATAPHGPVPDGAYPGTCRDLTARQRAARQAEGRPAAGVQIVGTAILGAFSLDLFSAGNLGTARSDAQCGSDRGDRLVARRAHPEKPDRVDRKRSRGRRRNGRERGQCRRWRAGG
jgi:hypothetical protein